MFQCPVFEPGQIVRCRHDCGYYTLTRFKTYTVTEYCCAQYAENGFRFDAKVSIIDDNGGITRAFAWRFEAL